MIMYSHSSMARIILMHTKTKPFRDPPPQSYA